MLLAPWAAPSLVLGLMLIGDALLYAILPTEAEAFGVSAWGVGVLLASNRLVRLVGMPAIVRVASRRGTGVVLSVAVVIAAATHLGYSALTGFWALWPMRLGWGLAYAAGNLAMLDAASADADRVGRRIGLARGASKLPPLLSLLVAPVLVASIGIGGVFAAAGLAALLALPLALRLPSEPVEGKQRRFGWPTAADRLLASVALAVDGVLVTSAGSLFAAQGTHGIVAASAVLAGLRLADLVLGPVAGQLCDRSGTRWVLLAGVNGVALGCLLIAAGIPYGAGLAVFCRPLVTPAIYAEVRRSSAGTSLTAIGRLATWRDAGAAVGPIFALGTLEAVGPGPLFAALAGLILWRGSRTL